MENAEMRMNTAIVEVDRPWLAMSSMLIGAFVGMLSETSLNIALPTLGRVFSVGTGTLQWLVTGYMLMIGIVLPFSSLISKWFSTRQIIIFALADFTVGALISGFANSFGMLLFGRMIQGIGTGLILPLMFTVAMLIFPPKKLGLAMGINALVIMFAPAIGPTVTGIVLGSLSWRAVFFMFAIILLVGLLFAFIGLKNVSRITRPKIDLPSVLGSVIGFSSIVAGTSLASEAGWTSPRVLGLLAVGIIVLVLYAGRQLKLDEPVLNLRVFAKPAFRTGAILVMLDFGIILSAMYLMPQFIQNAMMLPVAMSPSQTHALNALAGPESADGSTIMNTLQQIVGAIATALATSFLAMGQAASSGSESLRFTSGVHYGFYFTAVLVIAGLIVSLTLKERTKSSDVEM